MAVYRGFHIKQNQIPMVPVHGYVNSTNFSVDSIRWLDFLSMKEGVKILHALNGIGEKKIGPYSVDGFCEANNTVYEYHVSMPYI